jgi:hypothetical protein
MDMDVCMVEDEDGSGGTNKGLDSSASTLGTRLGTRSITTRRDPGLPPRARSFAPRRRPCERADDTEITGSSCQASRL